MDNLSGGMHTRIGAAGANDVDDFIRHSCQRFFEALLNAETGLLTLPAVVIRPVVFDAERDANSKA
jgi:hypothetical protein